MQTVDKVTEWLNVLSLRGITEIMELRTFVAKFFVFFCLFACLF